MKKAEPPILLQYQSDNFTLRDRTRLKSFIRALFRTQKQPLEALTIVFCSDEYLLALNNSFLQHDYYTDILTFSLAAPKMPVQGEIYISIDRVKDNAISFDQTFARELHRVIFHGCLHLCGLGDRSAAQIRAMRAAEGRMLKRYFGN